LPLGHYAQGLFLCVIIGAMGIRYWNSRAPEYVSFSERWPNVGVGRYWKRRLSKGRRKYSKMILQHGRGKEPTYLESMVHMRTW
jgi:hypothetical protein